MQVIRQNTSYALRALLHMATADQQDAFSAEQLAQVAGTTTDFMQKIMQSLRQAGIVTSQRGPSGGFRLARPPETIALLDVIVAVQGPIAISRCALGLDLCDRSPLCPLRGAWTQAQQLIEQSLSQTTLAQVVASASVAATSNSCPADQTTEVSEHVQKNRPLHNSD